jgi:glycosyltransferase involved in cell wall biosynthesis
MRSLYVSQNGLVENLGQSQVLPYLRGLASRGAEIDIVSFELPAADLSAITALREQLRASTIGWYPLQRTMGGSLPRKMGEAAHGVLAALARVLQRRPHVVHGRSYFPTAICDVVAAVSPRSKLLFDCRGMIGDEYVDCGYWKRESLEYRLVKTYERRLFRRSDGLVVLTRALRDWLTSESVVGSRPIVEVVPCCVDMTRFVPDASARERLRGELGLGDRLTLVYAGSLGTWYLEPEMAGFARALRAVAKAAGREVAFVCFSPSDARSLRGLVEAAGFAPEEIVVQKVAPREMPAHLAVGDVGLSFIQSCFSKKGSSPTKVAEYLACGLPVVVNGDIGDQRDLAHEREACVVLEDFGAAEIERAARAALELASRPREARTTAARDVARRHFGLEEVGVSRYVKLYEALAS